MLQKGHDMPYTAKNKAGLIVDAVSIVDSEGTYNCHVCSQPLRFVRASKCGTRKSHFVHEKATALCHLSVMNTHAGDVGAAAMEGESGGPKTKGPWHEAWQGIGREVCGERYEARGIGCEANKHLPRDLGDVRTQQIVELQHSPLTRAEYEARNEGVASAVWIFDATGETLWTYSRYAEGYAFCEDKFRSTYPTDICWKVVFHCQDGRLYRTVCDSPVRVEVDGETKYVRLLQADDLPCQRLTTFFADKWPLREWEGRSPEAYEPRIVQRPVRVLSEEGRKEVTAMHLAFAMRLPHVPCTVIHAPPGAGKTTSIVNMIKAWNGATQPSPFRVLVLTFNKATQQTMATRLRSAGFANNVATSMTVDKLCMVASGAASKMITTDKGLCEAFWPNRRMLHNTQPGRGLHSLIDFRLKHPLSTSFTLCDRHKKTLGAEGNWRASLESHPISEIVSQRLTFASCRYACDKDNLLYEYFKADKYDALVVDEVQDLASAQEVRLLRQFPGPMLLVGDPMQAINEFKNENKFCNACHFAKEELLDQPAAIEWYGSWRLDALTARFIEERFGRPLHSYRSVVERSNVLWTDELPDRPTLVLCRSNRSVYEIAQKYRSRGMKVVRGKERAKSVRGASFDPTDDSPFGGWARELRSNGTLDAVCRFLEQNSIEIDNLVNHSAASTVHQAKGFEYDHVAVHSDLLQPRGHEETCVSYVAFTRHRQSLTVLEKP